MSKEFLFYITVQNNGEVFYLFDFVVVSFAAAISFICGIVTALMYKIHKNK